jgi:hypothetical protein
VGAADPGGPRELVVGTGGKDLTSVMTVRANSEVRNYGSFGILELKLYPNGYEWRFLSDIGAALDAGWGLCHSALPASASDFYTVPPCRLVDTRSASPLAAGVPASIPVVGSCGIPSGAVAVVINATVISPTATGQLKLYPSGLFSPQTTVVSFSAQRNRASFAIVPLGLKEEIDTVISAGTAHLVLDVTGYFR